VTLKVAGVGTFPELNCRSLKLESGENITADAFLASDDRPCIGTQGLRKGMGKERQWVMVK
jgi:hypothetical protein